MSNTFGVLQERINNILLNKRDVIHPYVNDYYNVHSFYTPKIPQKSTCGKIVNVLIDALNQKQATRHRLPRFLIIMPDKDIFNDLDNFEKLKHGQIVKGLAKIVNWLMRQVDIYVRRKHLQISEKKPGAVCAEDPVVIYVNMIPRVDRFHEDSKMGRICSYGMKFSEILNEAVARQDQHIMNIKSLSSFDYFNRYGELSAKGKEVMWDEIDYLLERFDKGKVKLIPKTHCNRRMGDQHQQHQHWNDRKMNYPTE